jgi:hypothetical protein
MCVFYFSQSLKVGNIDCFSENAFRQVKYVRNASFRRMPSEESATDYYEEKLDWYKVIKVEPRAGRFPMDWLDLVKEAPGFQYGEDCELY